MYNKDAIEIIEITNENLDYAFSDELKKKGYLEVRIGSVFLHIYAHQIGEHDSATIRVHKANENTIVKMHGKIDSKVSKKKKMFPSFSVTDIKMS